MIRAWFTPPDDYVDVDDYLRKREIANAEYQAESDAGCRVLRVSGKTPYGPHRRVAAIIERGQRTV